MSIDPKKVRSVMLLDGKWYDLEPAGSFEVESYAFKTTEHTLYDQGTSFKFTQKAGVIQGPISSIVAIRLLGPTVAEDPNPIRRPGTAYE